MALSFTHAAVTLLAGAAITSAAAPQAATNPGKSKPLGSALTTTYRQRVSASPWNRPLKTESLVLPHAAAKKLEPFLAKPGRLRFRNPDLARIVWQILPKADKHQEYLRKRSELSGKDWRKLVTWCKQNSLETLAEYELRGQLSTMRDFRKPGYKSIMAEWLPLAQKRQLEYTLGLPVKGVWYVGVDRSKHHRIKAFAAFAFDLVIRKRGKLHSGNSRQNASYYAWGQPICAQADGIVEMVNDTFPDMPPGKSGGFDKANNIMVDYGAGILALYGHIQKGSATVKRGDRVTAGQELARVGNSGASGMPHLHFTMMDGSGFSVRGRYRFEQRMRGGQWRQIDAADLTEGTEIRPAPPPEGATTQPKGTAGPDDKPKPADRSPEQLAASKLRLARAYLSYNKEAKARALLQAIVKDYPGTPAAAEAKKELAKLK